MNNNSKQGKEFTLLGYFIRMTMAKTVWITTKKDQREWHLFNLSRTYYRPEKTYVYDFIFLKLKIMWGKIS